MKKADRRSPEPSSPARGEHRCTAYPHATGYRQRIYNRIYADAVQARWWQNQLVKIPIKRPSSGHHPLIVASSYVLHQACVHQEFIKSSCVNPLPCPPSGYSLGPPLHFFCRLKVFVMGLAGWAAGPLNPFSMPASPAGRCVCLPSTPPAKCRILNAPTAASPTCRP